MDSAPSNKSHAVARKTIHSVGLETVHKVARFGTPEAKGLDARHIIGKPHADRARQFMPFSALRGYDELVSCERSSTAAETISYEKFFE